MTFPALTTSKTIVGFGELRVQRAENDVLTTHALGSCIGVTVYDPKAGVALHYMLPQPTRAEPVPAGDWGTYATTGVPHLFKLLDDTANFQVGRRNHMMLRKLLWKNNITIAAEHIGGNEARTMRLDMRSGWTAIHVRG